MRSSVRGRRHGDQLQPGAVAAHVAIERFAFGQARLPVEARDLVLAHAGAEADQQFARDVFGGGAQQATAFE